MTQQSLQASIWWILPGRLAGMQKPEADELAILKAEGIGAIVSIMDDPSNLNLYEVAQIPYRWLPTKGGTAPTREQIDEFSQFVDAETQAGKAVAVHCSSGRRRTATFLGAYLILIGKNYEEAVEAIAQANPAIEMSETQLNFLNSMSNGQ
jgi:protein-tyrosine phosphatase